MYYSILVVAVLVIILLLLIWWFVVLSTSNSGTPEVKFDVNLDGDAVVPPVETGATGAGQAILSSDRDLLAYNIFINELNDQTITSAGYYQGYSGSDGPLLKTLTFEQLGTRAQIAGNWSVNDEQPLNSDLLLDNQVYLLIKTEENPTGLIRGQMNISNN